MPAMHEPDGNSLAIGISTVVKVYTIPESEE